MKDFLVTLRFIGLTGEYTSQVDVRARDEKSARRKAEKTIGNRDGEVIAVRSLEDAMRAFENHGDEGAGA